MKKRDSRFYHFIWVLVPLFVFCLCNNAVGGANEVKAELEGLNDSIGEATNAGDIERLNEINDTLDKIEEDLNRDSSISAKEAEDLKDTIKDAKEKVESAKDHPVVKYKYALNQIEKEIEELCKKCKFNEINDLERKLKKMKSPLKEKYKKFRDSDITDKDAKELTDRTNKLMAKADSTAAACKKKKAEHAMGALGINGDGTFNASALPQGVAYVENNPCGIINKKKEVPNDPLYNSKGTWGQVYDDQWGIKHVGFTTGKDSAWNIEDGTTNSVVIAVIDTGLDWNHKDFNWDNIWYNDDEIPENGKDDDDNGYVDDTIGWNFINNSNSPWDDAGHGTFISGIIAAATNNGVGVAGINRGAKIMVLKAINSFGHTRASFLSEAIFYAANNGARVINISAGGKEITRTIQEAVDYAHNKGLVIVVSAGNDGADTIDCFPSGLRNVIAVATTDEKNDRVGFSNWGQGIDIAAPGMDILSLRARRTDLMIGIDGVEYTPGGAYVGQDTRYYRASGTSFSVPIVAGTASLILARDTTLTNTQVERMLLQSTRDIEVPGWDQYTGFGLLDARAALLADPEYYLLAQIQKVQPVQVKDKMYLEVLGTTDSSSFEKATIDLGFDEMGSGKEPKKWENVVQIQKPVNKGRLGLIPAAKFYKGGKWTVRLQVKDKMGRIRESRAFADIE